MDGAAVDSVVNPAPKQSAINIVIRLMGLILLTLVVEFIVGGLKGLFPVLALNEI
jgi:small neutral amino acid transporter SnatA (MarC family)